MCTRRVRAVSLLVAPAQATRHAELEAIDTLLAAHDGDVAAAGFDRCAARASRAVVLSLLTAARAGPSCT